MGKTLIIAEKNSMARDIVSAIGGLKYMKSEDYYEGEQYVVVALSGHVLQWFDMEDYNHDLKKWELENLPYFPIEWKLKEKNDSYPKKKYRIARKLILRDDITEIINSGDPDNEGEVLVNEVIYKVFKENQITKPIKRIWILDHVPSTILKELKYAKNIDNTDNIYQEGLARSKTDWLYGINLTRYITCRTGRVMPTGRVIVPTVKYVYDRDLEIEGFVPEKYSEIAAIIEKDQNKVKINFKELKFKEAEKEKGQEILENLKQKKILVKDIQSKEQKRESKKLFKLSTLQIYCSNKFKFSPDKTLSLVQSLYEKGYLTYPRTNSEYMTEKEKEKAKAILKALKDNGYSNIEFKDTKKIFDDTKIDSHSAITPTEKIANINNLVDDEKKIYETVRNRFLSNFCERNCLLEVTTIMFELDNKYISTLKGAVVKQKGYLEFENDLSENELPDFKMGEEFETNLTLEEKQTTPPSKVTQAELIKFYNKPFRKFSEEDEENSKDDAEEYRNMLKGIEIGTEATRASTIAKVIKLGYIQDEKGKLSITDFGKKFIETLQKLNINLWKEKTVELSQMLKEVNKSTKNVADIEKYATDEIRKIIECGSEVKIQKEESNYNKNKNEIGRCPLCGNKVLEYKKSYGCSNYKNGCKFTIWKQIAGMKIGKTVAKEIINQGCSKRIDGFKSKIGKEFSASLILKEDGTIGFKF